MCMEPPVRSRTAGGGCQRDAEGEAECRVMAGAGRAWREHSVEEAGRRISGEEIREAQGHLENCC